MTQFAIFIYEREVPENPADLPAEILQAHMEVPARVAELGGKFVNGFAAQPDYTATSLKEGNIKDGPFVESQHSLSGFFIIEARDSEHAVQLAKLVPIMDGGVEVRPLLG